MDDAATRITGTLGFREVSQVLASVGPIIRAGTVDLSGVSGIDSAGVSLLLELTRRTQATGRSLTIRGANPQVRRLVTFFRLDPLLRLENDGVTE